MTAILINNCIIIFKLQLIISFHVQQFLCNCPQPRYKSTETFGVMGGTPASYSGSSGLESRPGNRLYFFKYVMVSLFIPG
jgi:hypothetical protein